MSSEQYQRTVNNLDKEIAALEKKKATADKKSVDEQKKATNITISKNASASMIKSKMKQIEQYQAASNKAAGESEYSVPIVHPFRKNRAGSPLN